VITTIERIVERYRQRMRAVLFARMALMSTAIAAGLATAWNVTSGAAPLSTAMVLLYSILGGLILSAAIAAIHTPSPTTMAHLIDRRLSTQNHVAAALPLAHDESAMSVLVVRGAVQKLSAVGPADVIPLAVSRYAAATVLSLALGLVVVVRDEPARAPAAAGGASAVGTQLRETSDAPDEGARVVDATAQAPAARPTGDSRTTGAPKTQADPVSNAIVGTRSPDDAVRYGDGREPISMATPGLAGEAPALPVTARSERVGESGHGSAASKDPRGAAAAAAAGTGAAAGAGGAIAVSSNSQAGGVSNAAQADRTASPSPPSDGPLATPQIAAVARAQATTAMTSDDIPPGFRRYVRDYFLRLQSSGGRQ
jgi:hypothetical protein